jgi:hypothetical protein
LSTVLYSLAAPGPITLGAFRLVQGVAVAYVSVGGTMYVSEACPEGGLALTQGLVSLGAMAGYLAGRCMFYGIWH